MDYKRKYEKLLEDLQHLVNNYNKPVKKSEVEDLKQKAYCTNFIEFETRSE